MPESNKRPTTDLSFDDPDVAAVLAETRASINLPRPVVLWRERARRNEVKRQGLVDAIRKQRPRRWITAFEIADEILQVRGSIVSKRERRSMIYIELARAIAEGKFEKDGQTHVHWFGGHGGGMTRSRLVTLARAYSPDGTDAGVFELPEFLENVVAQLGFPVDEVRRWLRDRGRLDPLSAEFGIDDEAVGASAPTAPMPQVASASALIVQSSADETVAQEREEATSEPAATPLPESEAKVEGEPGSTEKVSLLPAPEAEGAGARKSRRGPAPGTVDRYGQSDRALFPKIYELIKAGGSVTSAARVLAQQGKVAGTGTIDSKAKRLAALYLAEKTR